MKCKLGGKDVARMKSKMQQAINALADEVPNGHLLSSTGGHDLLEAATELIRELKLVRRERLRDKLLIAELLDLASERFGSHICNDFTLSPFLTGEEALELSRKYHRWNGDPHEAATSARDALNGCDFALMAYFAYRLREEVKGE